MDGGTGVVGQELLVKGSERGGARESGEQDEEGG
jgi:hypothetical protein